MDTITLQVPMSRKLRDMATKAALDQGVSSLQEAVRIFATRLAKNQTSISLEPFPAVKLSAKNEKRYTKMANELLSGKIKGTISNSAQEMFDQLGI